MKTKLFYLLSLGVLFSPGVLSAQLSLPTGTNLPASPITVVILALMQWLLMIVAVIAIIAFVISGILYLTAAGNETQAEKAKNALIYSIIGVIVAMLGMIVLVAVRAWLAGAVNF